MYSGIKKKKTNDKHTTQMNHKCIMFYEISQPQKAAHSMILFIWHSEKGTIIEGKRHIHGYEGLGAGQCRTSTTVLYLTVVGAVTQLYTRSKLTDCAPERVYITAYKFSIITKLETFFLIIKLIHIH